MPTDEARAHDAPMPDAASPSIEDRVAALEAAQDRLVSELQRHIGGFVLTKPEA